MPTSKTASTGSPFESFWENLSWGYNNQELEGTSTKLNKYSRALGHVLTRIEMLKWICEMSTAPSQLFYTGEKGTVSTIRISWEAAYWPLAKSHLFPGKKLLMETLNSVENPGSSDECSSTWGARQKGAIGHLAHLWSIGKTVVYVQKRNVLWAMLLQSVWTRACMAQFDGSWIVCS